MRAERGLTLIEMMIAVAIMTFLILLAAPSMTSLLQNRQIRATAESISTGLQLARAAAMARNTQVMFSLTSSVDDSCTLNPAGPHWIISSSDPTGACATGAQILEKRSNAEATVNTQIAATQNALPQSGQVVFNGFGRITPTQANDIWFDVTNPAAAPCGTSSEQMRCLRVVVSPGGMVRLCDPNISYSISDAQGC